METNKGIDEFNFIQLIDCITNYYYAMSHVEIDPSEEWKRKSGIISPRVIPEELNELVKKAFIIQIKKFI